MKNRALKLLYKLALPLILLSAFIFQVSLTNIAMHDDIIVQAGWGNWIFQNKNMFGFYENKVWIYGWPNQPPLISFLYGFGFKIHEWLNTFFVGIGSFIALHHLGASYIPWFYKFALWFTAAKFLDTPFAIGQLISLKLIPIIGNLALAGLIYILVKRLSNKNKALIYTIIYLISPFSWYESAIWGQHDQMAMIFVLSAFILLTTKAVILAPFIFLVSISLKTTGMIFIPLFAWLAFRDRKTLIRVVIGSLISLLFYYWIVTMISPNNFWLFNYNLSKQMFVKGDWATWVNTFNFWRITTDFQTDARTLFLGIRYQIWGYIFFLIVNIYVFLTVRKLEFYSVLRSLFIVSFGGWLLMTTMHERYLFTAIISGLLLTVKYPKMMIPWLILSLVFGLNLYYAWMVPASWTVVKNFLSWPNDALIPKLLSWLMIILFFRMNWISKK